MPVTFEQVVGRLLEPAGRINASDLRSLSALTSAQLGEMERSWPRIALEKRRKTIQMLSDLTEDNIELDYVGVFRIVLRDPDAEVRQKAVQGLWEDEEAATARAVVGMLRDDPSSDVRAAAATNLGHFIYQLEMEDLDPVTGEVIKAALYEVFENEAEPLEVRRRAAESLGYLAEERAQKAIERAYADPALKMRVSALFAMGRSCDERWFNTVLEELGSDESELRFEAARAAGELEDRRAVTPLLALVGDPDPEVRVAAVGALGAIGGPRARQALHRISQAGDRHLAAAAEEAIEELELFADPAHLFMTDLGEEHDLDEELDLDAGEDLEEGEEQEEEDLDEE